MSRYNKMMTEVLDAIFEGYTLDSKSGKLVVTNEAASKKAQESLHTLVLEKARELWDQLEAAEESLSSVAEEIRFEEMNTDPSSMSGAISQMASPEDDAAAAPAAAPDAGLGLDAAPALESAGSISELLSTDDLNLDDIFENMDQLDNHQNTSVPRGPDMPFDEMTGGMSAGNIGGGGMGMEGEGDIEDGDENYDALSMGMGDEGDEMGDPVGSDDGMGDPMADDGMDDMGGMDGMGDPEMGDGMDDMGGFDFDLDLDDPEMGGDLAMGDDGMGMEPEMDDGMGGDIGDEIGLGDEEEIEAEGMGRQSMRMEGKGEKPAFLKKGDKDDDKPAFLKKKKDD